MPADDSSARVVGTVFVAAIAVTALIQAKRKIAEARNLKGSGIFIALFLFRIEVQICIAVGIEAVPQDDFLRKFHRRHRLTSP